MHFKTIFSRKFCVFVFLESNNKLMFGDIPYPFSDPSLVGVFLTSTNGSNEIDHKFYINEVHFQKL